MEYYELLNRIRKRDVNAYLELTQTYGWKLYSHLRARFDDRELTEAAFNETLTNFYNTIAGGTGDDVVESLLLAYADQTCQKMKQTSMVPLKSAYAAKPRLVQESAETNTKPSGKSNGLGFGLGVGILVFGILAALWVIVGLLMDMNILPELDLGYSWFNSAIAPWF